MRVEHTPIPNQICALNNNKLTISDFKQLYEEINFDLPVYLCLTNYNDIAHIFTWMGLYLIDKVYNHNSSVTNYLYKGMLSKDKIEQFIEDGYHDSGDFHFYFIKQHYSQPISRFRVAY